MKLLRFLPDILLYFFLLGLPVGVVLLFLIAMANAFRAPPFDEETAHALLPGGEQVIQAVDEYERRFGLCPERLDRLVPEPLSPQLASSWAYRSWNNSQDFSISASVEGGSISFTTRELPSSWELTKFRGDATERRPLTFERHHIDVHELEHLERILVETARRFLGPRPELEAYRLHVSALVQAKRPSSAALKADQARARWPEHWWPHTAHASLLGQLGRNGAPDLERWAQRRGGFTAWYIAAEFLAAQGMDDRAVRAIRAAVAAPTKSDSDFPRTSAAMAWRMAHIALELDEHRLVTQICAAWNEAYWHLELLPMLAAAHLALGELEDAQNWAEKAHEELGDRATWSKGTAELLEAARRGDRSYEYEPGEYPGPLRLFREFRLGRLP